MIQQDTFKELQRAVDQLLAMYLYEYHNTSPSKTEYPLFNIQQENMDIVMQKLLKLLESVPNPEENIFLEEVLKCCYVGAWRAEIVMMWNLTVNHLYKHIFIYELDKL